MLCLLFVLVVSVCAAWLYISTPCLNRRVRLWGVIALVIAASQDQSCRRALKRWSEQTALVASRDQSCRRALKRWSGQSARSERAAFAQWACDCLRSRNGWTPWDLD